MEPKQTPLSYDDVANVCDALKAAQIQVTQSTVRTLLQRGSMSTINKFVNQWKEHATNDTFRLSPSVVRGLEAEIERYAYELTAALSDEKHQLESRMKDAISSLAVEQAEKERLTEELIRVKEAYERDVKRLASELEAERLERRSEQARLERSEEEMRENIKQLARMEAMNTTLQDENQRLQAMLAASRQEQEALKKEKEALTLEHVKSDAVVSELRNQLREKR